MQLSVAICTWNRCDLLERTLGGLCGLDGPPGAGSGADWELLLVDNNSTDATLQVAERFAGRLPLRYLFEPAQGLSHARNRAAQEAQGELVVWTDDDVLVDPGWLRAYTEAARAHPGTAFFGGPVEPRWLERPPAWLSRNLDTFATAFALRRLTPGAILAANRLPFGANMAIRRHLLAGTGFDAGLGRMGAVLASGEETAFLRALLARGETGLWLEEARVEHLLPAARASRGYLRDYFAWIGRTEMRARLSEGREADLGKLRRRRARLRRRAWLSLRRDRAWAEAFMGVAKLDGAIAELAAA